MALTITPGEIPSEVWGARTEPDVKYVVLPEGPVEYEVQYQEPEEDE